MASMTNCTQSWPMHLFWRCVCANRQVAQPGLMDAAKQNVGRIVVSNLILGILALIHCLLNIWIFTYFFLFTSSRWKLSKLRSTNTDLGVANLHDFPGTESFPLTPEQQWPSNCKLFSHIFISTADQQSNFHTPYLGSGPRRTPSCSPLLFPSRTWGQLLTFFFGLEAWSIFCNGAFTQLELLSLEIKHLIRSRKACSLRKRHFSQSGTNIKGQCLLNSRYLFNQRESCSPSLQGCSVEIRRNRGSIKVSSGPEDDPH